MEVMETRKRYINNNMKTFKQYITESFDSGTIQTSDIPYNITTIVKQVQNVIPKDILNTKYDEKNWIENGLQKKHHLTILYGIDDKDENKIKDIVKKYDDIKLSVKDINYFDNRKKSGTIVLKLDCESPELKKLHTELKNKIPNKHKYDFKPHITIAFLKDFLPKEIEDKLPPIEKEFKIDDIEISTKQGKIKKI